MNGFTPTGPLRCLGLVGAFLACEVNRSAMFRLEDDPTPYFVLFTDRAAIHRACEECAFLATHNNFAQLKTPEHFLGLLLTAETQGGTIIVDPHRAPEGFAFGLIDVEATRAAILAAMLAKTAPRGQT